MRAEWQRIEAEIIAFVSQDGPEFFKLHQLGYRLADPIYNLTPLQMYALSALRES